MSAPRVGNPSLCSRAWDLAPHSGAHSHRNDPKTACSYDDMRLARAGAALAKSAPMLRYSILVLAFTSLACVGEGDVDDPLFTRDGQGHGNISLEWAIYAGDMQQSCVDAGADAVEIVAQGDMDSVTRSLACLDGVADTGTVVAGDYYMTVRLVDVEGTVLSNVDLGELVIEPGRTTALGAIDFVVD
jgi:hypothetical protein